MLVSAFVGHAKPRRLISELVKRHELVTSSQLLAELADVLSREKINATPEQADKLVSLIARAATTVAPQRFPGAVPEDPDDEVVLGTACRGRASHVVTGDRHLLEMKGFRGVRIVTVAEMLDLLPKGRRRRR